MEYTTGFAHAMDGERDPVNLIHNFQLIVKMSQTIRPSLDAAAEEMFEVISCYYPINFTPPPNDPRNISPEHLATSLEYVTLNLLTL